jgi:hypothetical protein
MMTLEELSKRQNSIFIELTPTSEIEAVTGLTRKMISKIQNGENCTLETVQKIRDMINKVLLKNEPINTSKFDQDDLIHYHCTLQDMKCDPNTLGPNALHVIILDNLIRLRDGIQGYFSFDQFLDVIYQNRLHLDPIAITLDLADSPRSLNLWGFVMDSLSVRFNCNDFDYFNKKIDNILNRQTIEFFCLSVENNKDKKLEPFPAYYPWSLIKCNLLISKKEHTDALGQKWKYYSSPNVDIEKSKAVLADCTNPIMLADGEYYQLGDKCFYKKADPRLD